MQTMRVPENMYPMVDMDEQRLEEMYPQIYFIIYPVVINQCDRMDYQRGDLYAPTREEFDGMVEDVHSRVCDNLDENKQLGIDIKQWRRGSGELRDLISIILLREILQRRRGRRRRSPWDDGRRNFYGGPGFYY